MRKTIFLSLVVIFIFNISFAQDNEKYMSLAAEAYDLYKSEKYFDAAHKYSEAFMALGNKGYNNDRYNAACSYALAGVPDSAFIQLFKIANNDFALVDHLKQDSDLVSLHSNEKWEEVVELILANKKEAEKNYDWELIPVLDSVYETDQRFRKKISSVADEFGYDSPEMRKLYDTINKIDSINEKLVTGLLDERGWMGKDILGYKGNSALFLTIQHADIDVQEKYIPMLREAVNNGNARGDQLALMEDRVALRQGKRQIYGSQIGSDEDGNYFVSPMIDPENVNERRAEVGLGPIEDYCNHFNFTWDLERHIAKTKEIEDGEGKK